MKKWLQRHYTGLTYITIWCPSIILGLVLKSLMVSFATATLILILFSLWNIRHFIRENAFLWGFVVYLVNVIVLIFCFSIIYTQTGILNHNGESFHDIGSAFYFSVVTWTTLGYGDLYPPEPARFWVIIEALSGYIHMGILVGLMFRLINGQKK